MNIYGYSFSIPYIFHIYIYIYTYIYMCVYIYIDIYIYIYVYIYFLVYIYIYIYIDIYTYIYIYIYIYIIYIYTYIYIHFLNIFHICSLVCFLIYGVNRRQDLIAKPHFYKSEPVYDFLGFSQVLLWQMTHGNRMLCSVDILPMSKNTNG